MSNNLQAASEVDGTHYEEWLEESHDFDMEITEMRDFDHVDVNDFDLEHSEFGHAHIHHEDNTELVQRHFPHLALPPPEEDFYPVVVWLDAFVLFAVIVVLCYESLRYCIRARNSSSNAEKKKSKEKANTQALKSGPMPLAEALHLLCRTTNELNLLQNSLELEHTQSVSQYVETHYVLLSRLAFSLYEHAHKHFAQFEAVCSDTTLHHHIAIVF